MAKNVGCEILLGPKNLSTFWECARIQFHFLFRFGKAVYNTFVLVDGFEGGVKNSANTAYIS